jgi:hypothetical protein
VLLFRSEDLVSWEHLHPLYVGKIGMKSGPGTPYYGTPAMYVASGEGFHCPDFFPLGDKCVLVVSTMGESPYFVGRYVDHKFIPEKEGVLDLASSEAIKRFTLGRIGFSTAKTALDDRSRRIMWGTSRNGGRTGENRIRQQVGRGYCPCRACSRCDPIRTWRWNPRLN